MGNNRNYNYGMLSVFKLVAAILVVMIHTMAFSSLSENLWVGTSLGICRVAVPFFFIISGYFFYNLKSKEDRKNKIKKYTIFYFKAVLIEAILLIPYIMFLVKNMPMIILIRNLLLVGITGSLWYVSSMIIGLLFISAFLKNNRYKILILISIILFAFGLSGDSYYGLFSNTALNTAILTYKDIFVMMQVGFTASIPFLTLGILVNKFNLIERVKKVELWVAIGTILLIIEAFILYKTEIAIDYNLYISLLILAPALFIWALKSKGKVDNKTSNICRQLSILVYILHQPIMLLFGNFLPLMNSNSLLKFSITLILSILISLLLLKIKIDKFLKI